MSRSSSLFYNLAIGASLLFGGSQAATAAPLANLPGNSQINPEFLIQAEAPSTDNGGFKLVKQRSFPADYSIEGMRVAPSHNQILCRPAAKSLPALSRAALNYNIDVIGQTSKDWPDVGVESRMLYHLPHATGDAFVPMFKTAVFLNGCGFYDGDNTYTGVYYYVSNNAVSSCFILGYDLTTGEEIQRTQLFGDAMIPMIAWSVDRDPTTGEVYGFFYADDGASMVWGKADYESGIRTAIKSYSFDDVCEYLCCTSAGQFYGINEDGDIVAINKATGEMEALDSYLFYNENAGSACYDYRDNAMIVSHVDGSTGSLISVDLETMDCTQLATFPTAQIYNLFVMKPVADDKAPQAPEFTVSAPEGTMTIDYVITLPTTLMDASPLTGAVDWEITVNGEVKFEGRNSAGTTIRGQLTLEESGMTEFVATASNAVGKSPATKVSIFVGKGLPSNPTNVKAAYADGSMTITWSPITASTDGGYLNSADVRYEVFDISNPDADPVSLGADIDGDSYTFAMTAPERRSKFTYAVKGVYAGNETELIPSNFVLLGAYDVPFETIFKTGTASTMTTTFVDYGYTIFDGKVAAGYTKGLTWTSRIKGATYTYNKEMQADDWLFTPELYLEGGKVYEFTCMAHCSSTSYPERLEVKAGMGANVEAMTIPVIASTDIKALVAAPVTLSGLILVPEGASGSYNVGLHAISDPNMNQLTVTELHVSDAMEAGAPKVCTSVAVTPNTTGLLKATLRWTTPKLTVDGSNLSGNVIVDVYRNGELIASQESTTGKVNTYIDDQIPVRGNYEYKFKCRQGEAVGPAVTISKYIGPYPAQTPTSVEMYETYRPGTVTLTWTPVTKDIQGTAIPAGCASYMVYGVDNEGYLYPVLDENTTATTATFKALPDGKKQNFVVFVVHAFNRDAECEGHCTTDFRCIGTPYDLPVRYSNSSDLNKYLLGVSAGGAQWGLYNAEKLNIVAQDGDNQIFGAKGQYINDTGDFMTGKISLCDTDAPELDFYTYKLASADNNYIEVYVKSYGVEELVATVDHTDMKPYSWTKVRVDLTKYAGRDVEIRLRAFTKSYVYTFIDNLQVLQTPDSDLAITSIEAPATVQAEKEFNVKATIHNYGRLASEGYMVHLYRNGDLVETRELSDLPREEDINVFFPQVISYFDDIDSEAIYSVEVEVDFDADQANNISEEVVVKRPYSSLPAVVDLDGEVTEEGNKLTWSVYEMPVLVGELHTEDFESGEEFAHEFEGWTFLDIDGQPVGHLGGSDFVPGITPSESFASFFVFNASNSRFAGKAAYEACSGDKYLASIHRDDEGMSDDWAISPRLDGSDQTISLMAKSMRANWPESFEIWYSLDDSVDPEDFAKLEGFETAVCPEEWTRYEAKLPEGARRFAVRCVSEGGIMFFLDDISYIPDPYVNEMTLVGYNVYRNGKLISTSILPEGSFLDENTTAGSHTYHVNAVYSAGASELSNELTLERSGIEAVTGSDVKVGVEGRTIVVANVDGLSIFLYSTDGKLQGRAIGAMRQDVLPGIYLLKVGNRSFKVLVK